MLKEEWRAVYALTFMASTQTHLLFATMATHYVEAVSCQKYH